MFSEFKGWRSDGQVAGGLHCAENGGFEAGKGEIETTNFGVGEVVFLKIAVEGAFSD